MGRKALYEGKDVMPAILSDTQLPQKVGELAMFDADLLRLLGHIPNEYLYYYYYRDKASGNIHQAGTTRGISVEENNIQMLKELSAWTWGAVRRRPSGSICAHVCQRVHLYAD